MQLDLTSQSPESAHNHIPQVSLSSAPIKSPSIECQRSQNHLGSQHHSRDANSFSSQTQLVQSDPSTSISGPIHDIDLGFDPFQESQQGLAELVAAENNCEASCDHISLGYPTFGNVQRHTSQSPSFQPTCSATDSESQFVQWLSRSAISDESGFHSMNNGSNLTISNGIQPPPGFESRLIPSASDLATSELDCTSSHILSTGRLQAPYADARAYSRFSTHHQSSLDECIKSTPDYPHYPPGLVDSLASSSSSRGLPAFELEPSFSPSSRVDSTQNNLASCLAALHLQTNQSSPSTSNPPTEPAPPPRPDFSIFSSGRNCLSAGLKCSIDEPGIGNRSTNTELSDPHPSREASQMAGSNPLAQVDWNALAHQLYQLQQQKLLQCQNTSGSSVNSTAAATTQSLMMAALLMALGSSNGGNGGGLNGLNSSTLDPLTALTTATLIAQSSNFAGGS
ncbi:unnamed protein product, partial [Protopolystoma xenopodis]